MQPAVFMEQNLQRHPYALIFPPRPMRPWQNSCHNYLAADDTSGDYTV
jgi:hypothetical protein